MAPSPQLTTVWLIVPSMSLDVIVRLMVTPVLAVVADSVKLIVGGLSEIVFVAVVLFVTEPELSVAFT